MRIDAVTIFPDIFAALELSLIGRAREAGLIDLRVHDLRDFTHDRHRTIDDTPYGGGAGMVMRPEPWGEALDAVLDGGSEDDAAGDAERTDPPLIVIPTPAGRRFDQALARSFALEPWLVFCCGRYEGIDQRVTEYAATRARVLEVSIGDFVLNGGEVAVLAMVEAAARLIPGVIGNPVSLTEESHEDGLLEYPAYTKPAVWRELEVPAVLRSGDHAAVAAWRRERSLERTRRVRPDLLTD
ncbi:tRNA (guanosine(37)-N1)-methyltransferase TrmD [uncultured Amnibacterium sp.]|uniref:tRNA (guanosine(37)-N1)-methyltransferase TrmD n=1 Tax=uncultured Amnibacterium sp. TaxID=1631851 RepID=UPI0035CBD67C